MNTVAREKRDETVEALLYAIAKKLGRKLAHVTVFQARKVVGNNCHLL